jgi:hypothetical protein
MGDVMKEVAAKISSYNIFNFLFPGAVFVVCAERMRLCPPVSTEIVARLLIYYFVGMALSRVGSLIVEPAAKFLRIVRKSDYAAYVQACMKDEKLPLMVEVTNTYRTIAAGALCLLGGLAAQKSGWETELDRPTLELGITGAVCLLFMVSFKKQYDYVTKRVSAQVSAPLPSPHSIAPDHL